MEIQTAPGSGPTKSSRRSAPAAWARCAARRTRGSIATSRSRCCPRLRGQRPVPGALRARGEDDLVAEPPEHLHALRRRPRERQRLPRDGVHRGESLPTLARAAARRPGARARRADRRGARRRPPQGDRPPRPQARQHDADEDGSEAARLRPREARGPRTRGVISGPDGDSRPRRPAAHAAKARSSARSSTWRRSRSRGRRPTRAPTSSRSACVLYEMLTGQRAFEGKTRTSLHRGDRLGARRALERAGAADAARARARRARGASRRIPTTAGRRRATSPTSCDGSRKAGSQAGVPAARRRRRVRREWSRAARWRRARRDRVSGSRGWPGPRAAGASIRVSAADA